MMVGTGKLMVKEWLIMVDNGTSNGKQCLVMASNQCSTNNDHRFVGVPQKRWIPFYLVRGCHCLWIMDVVHLIKFQWKIDWWYAFRRLIYIRMTGWLMLYHSGSDSSGIQRPKCMVERDAMSRPRHDKHTLNFESGYQRGPRINCW